MNLLGKEFINKCINIYQSKTGYVYIKTNNGCVTRVPRETIISYTEDKLTFKGININFKDIDCMTSNLEDIWLETEFEEDDNNLETIAI